LRGQRQLAAGDKVELFGLAPNLQHDDAHRIAGQRIGGRPQRMIRISGAYTDEKTRIETKLSQPAHRQGTRFNRGEILPDPNDGPPRGHATRKPRDKARRRDTLPAGVRKHFVRGPQGKPALQARIGIRVPERRLTRRIRFTMGLDAGAQTRKRARGADLAFAILLTAIS
jgi:hypothetical protein